MSDAPPDADEPGSKPRPPGRRTGLAWWTLTALAAVVPLAQALSRYDWRADLLSHFPEPALVLTIVLFALALRRRRGIACVLALLACWQAPACFRHARPNPVAPDPANPARLKVLMANVFVDNHRFGKLAELIRRERPDVVALVEFTDDWQEQLARVRTQFAVVGEHPHGPSGVAVWFRHAGARIDPARHLRPHDRPFLHAAFPFAGAERHLFLIHPRQPLQRLARVAGNPELAALAEEVARIGGSRIVTGDMNTSDGSDNFRKFLQTTGLRDSRYGFGRQGSFPTFSPYRIAIDHALVSPDLAVVERRLGPSIGSDHYPLIFVLAPSAPPRRSVQP
jgi:endonuclease/exonuclease/phosphatase (EEP) superfamily protein YafD